MAPAKQAAVPACQVCSKQPSKYRCSTCPVRYCSVNCYKEHKTRCSGAHDQPGPNAATTSASTPAPLLEPSSSEQTENSKTAETDSQSNNPSTPQHKLLRPLTSLSWPPEPDAAIFTDPLLKDDPKPLRREELLRIAQSGPLRALLATSLPPILRLLDTLPPNARHATLSRILGLDPISLSRPGPSLLSGRDSPPPLEDLLGAFSGQAKEGAGEEGEGWWLTGPEARIWIGEKERELMRLFAGSVCMAIDGKEEEGKVVWGEGDLEWEV